MFALSFQGIALLGNAERGVLRHTHVEGRGPCPGWRRGNRSYPRGGGHLEAFGEYLASRPVLARRLAVNAFVLMAGVFLMLARTSPALAADNSHGQGKAQDRTSASAVVQRHDTPAAHGSHDIGGGDGNGNGNGDGKGSGSAAGKSGTSSSSSAK